MKKTRRDLLTFLLSTLVVVMAIFVIYIWQERFIESDNKPVIICPTETISVSVESLGDYSLLLRDVTALDVEDGDVTDSIVVESVSKFAEKGHCVVTYAAFDSSNNVSKYNRHLFLTDYYSPRFEIVSPLEFNYSSTFNPLSCIRVIDCVDGDISDQVKMNIVNTEDSIASVGAHMVEFKVTNSLGDTSVLETELDVYDKTYTETRMTPIINLSSYIVYTECYSYLDPMDYVTGIELSGVGFLPEEYDRGTIAVDDGGVDLNTPGTYRVLFTCDNRDEYFGSAILIVVVTEVTR